MRFHAMAPTRAARITCGSMIAGSMIPLPTVFATCKPKTAKAMKLNTAAQMTAHCGRRTRVDTMVAIEFAASWNPLMKSNANATTTIRMINSVEVVAIALCVLDDDAF